MQAERKEIDEVIRIHSIDKQREVEDNLIRTRVKNENPNSSFSRTLLYLLSMRPAKTTDLRMQIKDIHPDLCNDSVERVIAGKRFGKLWKHRIRNAQQCLRKSGSISYDKGTRLWHKTGK